MNSSFFSIVLPSYNRAHILTETVESVLKQTYAHWELIIIDDGSTDNTKELCKELQKSDNRIRYVYQKNAERSAARNNGIQHAKGKYICFLDSDDLFEPNHLEVLYTHILKNNEPIEFIFTNCYHLKNGIKEKPELPTMGTNVIQFILSNSIIPARVCVHNTILNELQFREDIVIVEDTVLWVSIANKYPVTQLVDYTIQYRLHDDNSVNIKNNCFLPRLKGLQKLFENKEIVSKAGKKLTTDILSDCYIGIYNHYEYKGFKLKKLNTLIKSILYYPNSKLKMKVYLLLSSLPITSFIIQQKEKTD